jgi:hypothetical protein
MVISRDDLFRMKGSGGESVALADRRWWISDYGRNAKSD